MLKVRVHGSDVFHRGCGITVRLEDCRLL